MQACMTVGTCVVDTFAVVDELMAMASSAGLAVELIRMADSELSALASAMEAQQTPE